MRLLPVVLACLFAGTAAADLIEMPTTPADPADPQPMAADEQPMEGDGQSTEEQYVGPEEPPFETEERFTEAPTEEAPAETVATPGKGMSMRQVEANFGQPLEKRPPVGDPPITRWVYGPYTVYFEHQYVIHSVLNR